MAKSTTGNKDPQNTQTSDRRRRSTSAGQNGADEAALKAARPRRRTASRPATGEENLAGSAAGREAEAPVTEIPESAAFGESASEQLPRATESVESTPRIDVPHEHIAVRAYHIYLERGGRGGDDFEDWITAERELRQRAAGQRISR